MAASFWHLASGELPASCKHSRAVDVVGVTGRGSELAALQCSSVVAKCILLLGIGRRQCHDREIVCKGAAAQRAQLGSKSVAGAHSTPGAPTIVDSTTQWLLRRHATKATAITVSLPVPPLLP